MEQWQTELIEQLLATEVKEVEEGTRVYTSSKLYGDSRYHLLDKKYDGVQIEQINVEEKWGSRVLLREDEIPMVLKVMLGWWLEDARTKGVHEYEGQREDQLDDHPF